jgi:exonuclease SbcD
MRLIHTSDWHLGHEILGFDRGPEHDHFLLWLKGQVTALAADVLLVTGDLYDTVNPSTAAQGRLYEFLASLLREVPGLQIVLTGGNHDSAARLELPCPLLDRARITIIGAVPRKDGRPDPAGLSVPLRRRDGIEAAWCVAIPYLRPGDLPEPENGESGIARLHRLAIAHADATRRGLPLVVTGHLHVTGGEISELSERRVVIGGEETVPVSIYPPHAAYVALGHLHRPQRLMGPTEIRYAGSPFPLSVTERHYRHGILLVELDADGRSRVEPIQAPRLVPFLRVPAQGAASLEAIEAELQVLALDDPGRERRPFLEVVVQLDGPQPDLRRRIDQALQGKPVRLVRIGREAPATAACQQEAAARELAELAETDVFAELHRAEHGGQDPAPDLLQAFKELLTEVQQAEGASR